MKLKNIIINILKTNNVLITRSRHRLHLKECYKYLQVFLDKKNKGKKLYVSFVMRKKVGNAVKRNRIKRKLRSIVQKLSMMNSTINLDYIYVIFGKDKAYKEYNNSLYEKMKKSFKRMQSLKV